MTYMDAVIILIAGVLVPIHGWLSFPRIRDLVRRGGGPMRIRAYRSTIAMQWLVLGLVIVAWINGERSAADLGLVWPATAWGAVVGVAGVAVLAALLTAQVWAVKSRPKLRRAVARQLQNVDVLIPRDRHQYKWFAALSITAGICEEVLYRGFLIWIISQWASLISALLLSALIFGIAHSYQGVRGVARTCLVGIGLGALYLFSGSLWPPIAAHALIDLFSGLAGFYALTGDGGMAKS